ncbi:MAG: hypothetical protein ACPHID_01005 [Thermoplasmatota archaeon]
MQHKTAYASLLAILALVAHIMVPLGITDDGVLTRHAQSNLDVDPVPGASMGIWLLGQVLLVLGLGAAWRLKTPGRFIGAGVAALGAAIGLRAAALWTGRGVVSVFHAGFGSDGPPQRFTDLQPLDHHAWFVPIAPVLIMGLIIVAMVWMLRELAQERTAPGATAHARVAILGLVVLAVLPTVPWAVEETVDATSTAQAEDVDLFLISAYDASRLHVDSQALAASTGENGLSQYDDVAWTHGVAMAVFIASATATLLGLVGLWRLEEEDKYVARSLELGGATLGLLTALGAAFATILVAVFLSGANERIPADPAWVPLLALIPIGLMLPPTVGTIRRLGAEKDRLVVDRFPEPIQYD